MLSRCKEEEGRHWGGEPPAVAGLSSHQARLCRMHIVIHGLESQTPAWQMGKVFFTVPEPVK